MDEIILNRIQEVDAEIDALTNDYKTLTNHIKEVETKIIFTRGKKAELALLANEINKEKSE